MVAKEQKRENGSKRENFIKGGRLIHALWHPFYHYG